MAIEQFRSSRTATDSSSSRSELSDSEYDLFLPWLESGVCDDIKVPYIFAHPQYDDSVKGEYKLNAFEWRVHMILPETIKERYDSPYYGMQLYAHLTFPIDDYPFKPPRLTVETDIVHYNLSKSRDSFYVYVLDSNWSPALSISKILYSLLELFVHPHQSDATDIYDSELRKRFRDQSACYKYIRKYLIEKGVVEK